jgi:hypothetical protein
MSSMKIVVALWLLTSTVSLIDLCTHQTSTYLQKGATALNAAIDATSWGSPRVDVFGIAPDKTMWHKYDVGSPIGWQPRSGFENMNATAFFYPSVVSWGQNRLDYFHIGKEDAAHHKYWDGSQWVRCSLST